MCHSSTNHVSSWFIASSWCSYQNGSNWIISVGKNRKYVSNQHFIALSQKNSDTHKSATISVKKQEKKAIASSVFGWILELWLSMCRADARLSVNLRRLRLPFLLRTSFLRPTFRRMSLSTWAGLPKKG